MRQGRRYGLSAEQKADIWHGWEAGESLHEIGRAFGKDHGSIQFLLSQHGGIAPAVRRRSQRTLTVAEREDISRGIASGWSIREIARGLERAASTVSREIARHGERPVYRASEADQQTWKSALRPKACLLARHRKLRLIVASKLILNWSPEQISGWLKRRYPSNESMRVSHETIYRSLFIQARGVLKRELIQHLRSKRHIRRSRHAQAAGQSRGHIVDAISIRERPAEIEDRAIPGHWRAICSQAPVRCRYRYRRLSVSRIALRGSPLILQTNSTALASPGWDTRSSPWCFQTAAGKPTAAATPSISYGIQMGSPV